VAKRAPAEPILISNGTDKPVEWNYLTDDTNWYIDPEAAERFSQQTVVRHYKVHTSFKDGVGVIGRDSS
jgi:hypothetical protein